MFAQPAASPKVEVLDYKILIVRDSPEKNKDRIPDVEFLIKEVKVALRDTFSQSEPVATIPGRFKQEGWSLVNEKQMVLRGSDLKKDFNILVPLRADITPLILTAISPEGEVHTETIVVQVPNFETIQNRVSKTNFKKAWGLSVGFGPTLLNYKETLEPDFSSIVMTGKVAFSYRFNGVWDLAANTYLSIVPITKSRDESLRFMGLNLRIGYRIPWPRDPWALIVMPGWYYISTFVTDNKFGFSQMTGPQVYPVLRRSFRGGASAYAYFKYSPITPGFSIPTFKSNEIATGAGYTFLLGSYQRPLSFGIDYSRLTVNIQDIAFIEGQSFSFSIGTSF